MSGSLGALGKQTITYTYDQNGLRTQKTVTPTTNATAVTTTTNGTATTTATNGIAVTTNYYYNGSVLMGMVKGTGATAIHQLFSYDASGNVVSVDYSSNGGSTFTTYYYLRNAQNDVVKLIDGSGTTVVSYVYDSWGKVVSTTGTLASTLGQNQPFRYRGYVYDAETGWYYLQSRYYDPTICRFISADVLLSTGQGVLGHNAFVYCLNNPVNMSDEGGLIGQPTINNTMTTDGASHLHFSTVDEAVAYIAATIQTLRKKNPYCTSYVTVVYGHINKANTTNYVYYTAGLTYLLDYTYSSGMIADDDLARVSSYYNDLLSEPRQAVVMYYNHDGPPSIYDKFLLCGYYSSYWINIKGEIFSNAKDSEFCI